VNLTLEIRLFELHIFDNYLAYLMCYRICRHFPWWSIRRPSGQEAILSCTTIIVLGDGRKRLGTFVVSDDGISVLSWHAPSRIILTTNITLNKILIKSFIFERYRQVWETIKTLKDRNSSICPYFASCLIISNFVLYLNISVTWNFIRRI